MYENEERGINRFFTKKSRKSSIAITNYEFEKYVMDREWNQRLKLQT